MYITINDIIDEKRIDLSYPIHSFKQRSYPTHSFKQRKEIAVITMFSDNIQYEIVKPHTIMDPILDNKKLIPCKTLQVEN